MTECRYTLVLPIRYICFVGITLDLMTPSEVIHLSGKGPKSRLMKVWDGRMLDGGDSRALDSMFAITKSFLCTNVQ